MEVKNTREFGNVLRARRKELNYTQEFIYDTTKLSQSFVSNIENGKETAEIGKVIEYAKALGLKIIIEER